MARERLVDQQPAMDGGLNDVSDESALQPNQLRRATNLRLTDYGAATKRGGTQRTSTNPLAAAAVLNGFTFQQDSGTNQILAVCNTDLFTATYGTFPRTYTNQGGTLSTTVPPDFAQLFLWLIFACWMRCTQNEHFSMTPRMRTVTSGLSCIRNQSLGPVST